MISREVAVLAQWDAGQLMLLFPVVLWCGALCYCDLRWNRLPDVFTIPAGVGAVVTACMSDIRWCWGALMWAGTYLVVGLLFSARWGVAPDGAQVNGSVGGGDIKLAVPLGIATYAALGAGGVLFAMALAQVVTILYFLMRWTAGSRVSSAPHGPAMLIAVGVVLAENLMLSGSLTS